jgi:hypothetical protein
MYVFGGSRVHETLSDLWALDLGMQLCGGHRVMLIQARVLPAIIR